jgi:hypothetical protein
MAITQSQEPPALPEDASGSEQGSVGASTTSLVKGATLPPVSAQAKIGRELLHVPRGRGMKVLYDRDDVPDDLRCFIPTQDFSSPDDKWGQPEYLKQIFKRPSPTGRLSSKYRIIPPCLLLLCKTLEDRLIVINWWIQLTDEERKNYAKRYLTEFEHPNTSCRLKDKYDPLNPSLVGIMDTRDVREQAIRESASFQIANKSEKRKAKDSATSNAHLRDIFSRTAELNTQKKFKKLAGHTEVKEDDRQKVTAVYVPLLLTYSTATTPTRGGQPNNATRTEPKISMFGPRKKEDIIPLLSHLSTMGGGHGDGQLMWETIVASGNQNLFFDGPFPYEQEDEANSNPHTNPPAHNPFGNSQDERHASRSLGTSIPMDDI